MKIILRAAVTGTVLLVLGCASQPQFGRQGSILRHDPQEQVLGFAIAVIELDEQGEMFDRMQFVHALKTIEEANANPKGAMVFAYVHGWNHSASPENETRGNLADFRDKFLRRLAAEEATGEGRPVVGVYVAWRGKSAVWPLSYWSRNAAASRVASLPSTEVLYGIQKKARTNAETRLLIVGHSMGGLIVEQAMMPAFATALMELSVDITKAQKAAERLNGSTPETIAEDHLARWNPPADLVLLINPASPALEAKKFVDMLHAWRARFHLEKRRIDSDHSEVSTIPLMVSLTSEGDWPNRWPFTTGNLLARRHERTRRDVSVLGTQRSLLTHTAGNVPRLQTHEFEYPRGGDRERPAVCNEVPQWEVAGRTCYKWGDVHFAFKRTTQGYNDTPYWLMRLPTTIVPDHSSIFDDSYPMIRGLLETIHALRRERKTLASSLSPELALNVQEMYGAIETGVSTVGVLKVGRDCEQATAQECECAAVEPCKPCECGKPGPVDEIPCWELPATPDDCFEEHTVLPGDWLSKLAARQYGDKKLWPFIHRFNDQVKNPNLIFPGERLRYPRAVPPR
ncbi:MAG: LysM peptidoglycan-binding domain-containing protein [Thermoanaerobaculia bacterium]